MFKFLLYSSSYLEIQKNSACFNFKLFWAILTILWKKALRVIFTLNLVNMSPLLNLNHLTIHWHTPSFSSQFHWNIRAAAIYNTITMCVRFETVFLCSPRLWCNRPVLKKLLSPMPMCVPCVVYIMLSCARCALRVRRKIFTCAQLDSQWVIDTGWVIDSRTGRVWPAGL